MNLFFSVFQFRAKQLYSGGYKTLAHLANAHPNLLVKSVENLSNRQANQIIASAKVRTLIVSLFYC